MGPGTIGTLGFMSSYAKNSPQFRQLQGVQRTLQFATPRSQNITQVMALDAILSSLSPNSEEYSDVLNRRNALLFGNGNPALQNLAVQTKNPTMRLAIGVLNLVQQMLGIRY